MRTFLKKNSIKNFLFFIILSCLGQSPLAAMEEDSAEEITFLAAHRAWDGRVKVLSEKDGEVPIDGEYDYVLYFKNKDVIDIIFDDCGVAYWAFCFYSADPDLSKQIQDYQKQGQSLSTLFEEEKASFSNQEVRFQSNQSLFSALSASMVAQESLSHAGGMQQHHISSLLKKSLHTLSDQVRSGKVIKVSDIKEVCALLAFELRRQTFVRYQATKLIDGEFQFTKDYSDPITAINSDFTTYDHDRGRQITFTLQNAQQDHALNAVFRHLQFFDTEGITDEQQDSCQESRGILPEVKLQTDGGVIHFDQTNLRFVYDANELLEEVKPMARAMREHIIKYIAKQEELQRLKELEMEDLPDLEQEGDSNLESDTP